jgi:tetratricopeptide (TPR) repeat protein
MEMLLNAKAINDCHYVLATINQCADLHKRQKEYDIYIEKADLFFNDNKYSKAKQQYEYAIDMKPNSGYAIYQMLICDFNVNISKADQFYEAEKYESALKYYDLAERIMPGNKSFKKKHKKCKRKVK